MVNAQQLRKQAHWLNQIRLWFKKNDFLEVLTPIRVPSPALEETLHAFRSEEAFLQTSPEFAMKRIIALGLCRIYQIAPSFRKEEVGHHHSSEFRMLEWYAVGQPLENLQEDLLSLLEYICQKPLPAVQRINASKVLNPNLPPDEWFFKWVDEIEPQMTGITLVEHYPSWQAALAKKMGPYAERFELYWNGIELANAFHEECSAEEIRQRWVKGNNYRIQNSLPPHPIDEQFLNAVSALPRTSGIALGLDRLFMILSDLEHIANTQITYKK